MKSTYYTIKDDAEVADHGSFIELRNFDGEELSEKEAMELADQLRAIVFRRRRSRA